MPSLDLASAVLVICACVSACVCVRARGTPHSHKHLFIIFRYIPRSPIDRAGLSKQCPANEEFLGDGGASLGWIHRQLSPVSPIRCASLRVCVRDRTRERERGRESMQRCNSNPLRCDTTYGEPPQVHFRTTYGEPPQVHLHKHTHTLQKDISGWIP